MNENRCKKCYFLYPNHNKKCPEKRVKFIRQPREIRKAYQKPLNEVLSVYKK